ncbi:MAG: PfkB family carbohydrate kinase [Planctomycetota bacterium]|nr:PfkB family carbohydrate kinase [Planctomycetota bacterium]
MSLLVTGTIGIDLVEAPTGRAEHVLGGSATYFSAAASFYGPVRLVAAVGDDFPASARATLAKFPAIDASGLETRRGSKTFRWGGRYAKNMNSRETLYTELGVVAEVPPPVPPTFTDSAFVFLANMHPAVQRSLLEQVPKRTLTVADTMDLWINIARADLLVLLRQVDGLVLNYDEAEMLTGRANAVAAGRAILEMGPTFVVVKKGEHGALLMHRDGVAALPAYPAEHVVDPTGAGDTFAGGLMGAIAANSAGSAGSAGGKPASFEVVRRAMAHGTVIASFTIEDFSLARLEALTKPELDARYEQYVRMVRM